MRHEAHRGYRTIGLAAYLFDWRKNKRKIQSAISGRQISERVSEEGLRVRGNYRRGARRRAYANHSEELECAIIGSPGAVTTTPTRRFEAGFFSRPGDARMLGYLRSGSADCPEVFARRSCVLAWKIIVALTFCQGKGRAREKWVWVWAWSFLTFHSYNR